MTKQKMKTRKLGRIREEPKSRKGEDEDDFGKSRDKPRDIELQEENSRRIQEYRGNKMREKLEIKEELRKQHRGRSEMSCREEGDMD